MLFSARVKLASNTKISRHHCNSQSEVVELYDRFSFGAVSYIPEGAVSFTRPQAYKYAPDVGGYLSMVKVYVLCADLSSTQHIVYWVKAAIAEKELEAYLIGISMIGGHKGIGLVAKTFWGNPVTLMG